MSQKSGESNWEDDCLLAPQEAAKLLGVSVGTIENWRWHGLGPTYVKFGKAIRYQRQALREYVTAHTHTPSVVALREALVKESPDARLVRLRAQRAMVERIRQDIEAQRAQASIDRKERKRLKPAPQGA